MRSVEKELGRKAAGQLRLEQRIGDIVVDPFIFAK